MAFHFIADIVTLFILAIFVLVGLYFTIKNANEEYDADVYIPVIFEGKDANFDEIKELLVSKNVSSSTELEGQGTPQNKALRWVSYLDEATLNYTDPRVIQRYVLMVLYYQCGGTKWSNYNNWMSVALECEWYGIGCNGELEVTNITLDNNKLEGIIPSELSSVDSLEVLELNTNSLKGTNTSFFDGFFQHDLINFKTFDVSNNYLSGTIPAQFEKYGNLTKLSLINNEFTGSFPVEITNLRKLVFLGLSSNSLTGTLPRKISNFNKLQDFLVGDNELSGELPVTFAFMKKLINLDLYDNKFQGTFPEAFGSLVNLERLQLAKNSLEGNITTKTVFGKFSDLQYLTLEFNNFTGTIPPVLCNMTNYNILKELYADCLCSDETKKLTCPCCTSCCCHLDGQYECDSSSIEDPLFDSTTSKPPLAEVTYYNGTTNTSFVNEEENTG